MLARSPAWLPAAIVISLMGPLSSSAVGQKYTLQQVDLSNTGVQGDGPFLHLRVSGDGRYVAYTSLANTLVPGDTNGKLDVFVRDLTAGTTERVSLGVNGQQVNGESWAHAVSYDGRYVLFVSYSADVHPGDPEALGDVYVRDRWLGTTEFISEPFDGSPSVYDCHWADMSSDGRYVVFDSGDSNLAPGDANGVGDVFRRDRWLGATEIVSRSSDGTQGDKVSYDSAISSDGSRIVFRSKAKNFYPNTDAYWHVFLRDMSTGMTHAVDVNPSGQLGNQHVLEHPAVSPDGSTVVFVSQATDLLGPDWFIVHPKPHLWREGKPLEPIPLADGRPGWSINDPSMSFDGRFVAFEGGTQHYVPGDPTQGSDILLQDTLLHATQQVSSNGYDNPANFQTLRCSMSWDGRVIAFVSYADNLVPGTTGGSHVYVRISDPLTSGMVYCWPGKSTIGCQPQLALGGLPSATAGNGHDLRVEQAPNGELGLLVYSTSSSKPNLLSTGWLCVSPPLRRMPVHATGGSLPPAADCSGAFAEDFNAWIALGQDPALTAGAPVWVQGWIRDPSAAGGAIFSDAVAFIVGP